MIDRVMRVKPLLCALFLFMLGGTPPALSQSVHSETASASSRLEVRIVETEIDLSPNGVTSNECLLVRPDGSYQLERRLQKLPAALAARSIYVGELSNEEKRKLEAFLNAPQVRELPAWQYQPPKGDSIYAYQGFLAQIPRAGELQSVGYYSWKATAEGDSPASAPQEWRIAQEKTSRALAPLDAWFHRLITQQTKPSETDSPICADWRE